MRYENDVESKKIINNYFSMRKYSHNGKIRVKFRLKIFDVVDTNLISKTSKKNNLIIALLIYDKCHM